MPVSRYRFRPRPWASIAAACGIAATLSLANWQLNRADEKAGRQAILEKLAGEPAVRLPSGAVDAGAYEFRKVEVSGKFEPQGTIYLDNKIHAGQVGFEVVTPLRIGDSRQYVLVNRGWVAAHAKRDALPVVATPAGAITLSGIAVVPSKKFLELSGQTRDGPIWQNLVLERYSKLSGLNVQPVVIQQTSATDDALVRDWARPDTGIARHQGYAFQWFALAMTMVALYLALSVKKC